MGKGDKRFLRVGIAGIPASMINEMPKLHKKPELPKLAGLSDKMTKDYKDISRFNVITIGDHQFNVVKDKRGGLMYVTILSFINGDRYFAEIEVDTEEEWQELFNAVDAEWLKDNFHKFAE